LWTITIRDGLRQQPWYYVTGLDLHAHAVPGCRCEVAPKAKLYRQRHNTEYPAE